MPGKTVGTRFRHTATTGHHDVVLLATIVLMVRNWQGNDDYSAGQLVRWSLCSCFGVTGGVSGSSLAPCWWVGMPLLHTDADGADLWLPLRSFVHRAVRASAYSASLVIMVAGWQVFRRILWIMLFMLLMVPLPRSIHNMISSPLQGLATTGSVALLEAFGVQVNQQGMSWCSTIVRLSRWRRHAAACEC